MNRPDELLNQLKINRSGSTAMKKKRHWPWIVGALVVIVAAILLLRGGKAFCLGPLGAHFGQIKPRAEMPTSAGEHHNTRSAIFLQRIKRGIQGNTHGGRHGIAPMRPIEREAHHRPFPCEKNGIFSFRHVMRLCAVTNSARVPWNRAANASAWNRSALLG